MIWRWCETLTLRDDTVFPDDRQHEALVYLAGREDGAAVLLISEDLDEIMKLADRIVVMYAGQIMGSVPAAEATRERLGLLMGGQKETSEVRHG